MDTATRLTTVDEQFAAFLSVVESRSLAARVPACPGWDVRQLALHVGETYDWVRAALRGTDEPADAVPPVLGDADVPSYLAGTADALLSTLRSIDPGQPCWTMAPPGNAAFWLRRMVHETTMHRWDAQSAHGRTNAIPSDVAYDGVFEVGEMFFPRQVRLGRIEPLRHTLRLRISDVGEALTLGPDGIVDEVRADAWVSGTAESVLLLLWKRIDATDPRLRFGGDPDALEAVLSVALTP